MARKINKEGLEAIKKFEGLRLKAYRDSAGILTIFYGHTSVAGPPEVWEGMTGTREEAEEVLRRDLTQYENAVDRMVRVSLTENQFSALVSFCYNIGPTAFGRSTLLKRLNAGDYDAVPRELMKWNKAGGKTLKGLTNRRAAEAGLWAKGSFVASKDAPAKPAKPPVATIDNGIKVLTPLTAFFQAFTSGPAQIILAVAFVAGATFLLYRWHRSQKEAAS